MVYHLTEEVSRELLSHLGSYLEINTVLNAEAHKIMMRYYDDYKKHHKGWFFGPMKPAKFFSVIATDNNSFEVTSGENPPAVYSFNDAKFNFKKLQKYKIAWEPVSVCTVYAAIKNSIFWQLFSDEVQETFNRLNMYSSFPLSVDDKIITMFNRVKSENTRHIELLALLGVHYEL